MEAGATLVLLLFVGVAGVVVGVGIAVLAANTWRPGAETVVADRMPSAERLRQVVFGRHRYGRCARIGSLPLAVVHGI